MKKFAILFEFTTPVGVLNSYETISAETKESAGELFVAKNDGKYEDLEIVSITDAV